MFTSLLLCTCMSVTHLAFVVNFICWLSFSVQPKCEKGVNKSTNIQVGIAGGWHLQICWQLQHGIHVPLHRAHHWSQPPFFSRQTKKLILNGPGSDIKVRSCTKMLIAYKQLTSSCTVDHEAKLGYAFNSMNSADRLHCFDSLVFGNTIGSLS